MTECGDCGASHQNGYFHLDEGVFCRACRNDRRETRTPKAREMTDDPHREQRSRYRVVNNVVNQ